MHLKTLTTSLLLILLFPLTFWAQTDPILFQTGMYQSEKIGIIGNSCYYLKFLPNGKVLRTFSDRNKETPIEVEKRMTLVYALTNDNVSMGTYTHVGSRVSCVFIKDNFKETYQIQVIELGLIADYQGYFNRKEKYTYWKNFTMLGNSNSGQNTNTQNNNSQTNTTNTTPLRPLNIGVLTKPKVYAVIVGVAKYNHINSLNYSDDDAYRFYAFLKSPEGGALQDDQLAVLIDEAATRDNILNTLRNTFSKAGPNDLVLFYFSGHGEAGAFLPYDFNGYSFKLTHSSLRTIFDQSKAKNKVCIADACHSGSLDKSVKSTWASSFDGYYQALQNSRGGLALFMSSKGEETSMEINGLRQGIFTYYMMDGLRGNADYNRDKVITIQELYSYVTQKVKSYTGNRQSPVIHGSYDQNMPIGSVR